MERFLDASMLDPRFWFSADTQIWILWIAGAALALGGSARLLTRRAWWLGIAVVAVGVIASWPIEQADRSRALAIGSAIVAIVFLVMLLRGDIVRPPPDDYERELIKLCGSRRRADRLIFDEMRRQPKLSRNGAALALVARLRHEKDGGPPPL